jgi:PAS domain S-box-containing protein
MITLLYVDDEPALLSLGKIFLERQGEMHVETVQEPEQVLDMLSVRHYDAIIADYQMPGMNGIELLISIRKRYSKLPFILFTGKGREDVVIEALNNGANFYLQKGGAPRAQFAELTNMVNRAVELSRADERLERLNRALRMISACNAELVRATDEEELLKTVCRVIVEEGSYKFAWVGYQEVDRISLHDVGWAGDDRGYLDACRFNGKESDALSTDTATALSTGKPAVSRNLPTMGEMVLNKYALLQGFAASIAVPLNVGRVTLGVLKIYSDQPDAFDHEEVTLLTQLAGDLSYGISALRKDGERKRAKQLAWEMEDQYRIIFENSGTAMFFIEEDRSIALVNTGFSTLCGFTKAEIEGKKKWTEFFEAEDLEKMKHYHHLRRKNGNRAPGAYEARFITANGDVRTVILTVGVIPRTSRSVASMSDITDQKKAQQALLERENWYRAMVNDQTEFICRFLPDGTFTFVNEAYCTYFNRTYDQFIGHAFTPVLYKDDIQQVQNFFKSLTPEHPVGTIENRCVMPSGEVRWQQWSDRAIFDDFGNVLEYQSVGRDITRQKQAELALQQVNKKMALLARITRHDMLNKLTAIHGYIMLVQENSPTPAVLEPLAQAEIGCLNIREQLEFTRDYQEMGTRRPDFMNVKESLMRGIAQIDTRDLSFTLSLGILEVYSDPLFDRVFYNLVENSIRHGHHVTAISVSAVHSERGMMIVYEDNGCGVPDDQKEQIFVHGFGKNTGLGLFLIKEILGMTGITIRETGKVNQGIRFELMLPEGGFRESRTGSFQ